MADPTTNACTINMYRDTAPVLGAACAIQGSVAWSIEQWFADSSDWVVACDRSNTWTTISKAKKKTVWESAENADKTWVRIDVDTTNKATDVPDTPSAWLQGNATGLTTMNKKCDDAVPSGWGQAGALFICIHGLTNQQEYVGTICSRGVSNDTPNCEHHVAINEGAFGTLSTDCPMTA